MKMIFCFLVLGLGLTAQGKIPEPVITVGEVMGRLAVVAGRLSVVPERPVGISVTNGNIVSSTLSDEQGRWSVVIRHLSHTVSVSSWNLNNPSEKGGITRFRLDR